MLDDRIIVQDRPDYGLAALLQNTKGVDAATMAMMNNGGFGGNYWVWLILLLLWGGNGFGNRGNAQFAELQSQISSNQNANLIMDGIKGNASAISTLASNLNCDFNSLNSAICSVQSAIQNVAAQTGLSGECIINAVNMGDCGIVTAIKDCCCNTQKSIMEMGYQNQLQNCQQTNTLTSEMTRGFSGLNFAIQNGFSQLGYTNANQTCELLNAGNQNTQRIIDTLNNHWNADLQQRYNDARLELSQKAQNEYLISQLRTTTTTTPAA